MFLIYEGCLGCKEFDVLETERHDGETDEGNCTGCSSLSQPSWRVSSVGNQRITRPGRIPRLACLQTLYLLTWGVHSAMIPGELIVQYCGQRWLK